MSDSESQTIQAQFASIGMSVSKHRCSKIGRSIKADREEAQIEQAFEGLDQLHRELETSSENPGLRTGEKQARNDTQETAEKPGKNGNIPPPSGRFQPGQSGNPGGRPSASVTRLVRDLLSHNDAQLAKKVAQSWIDQACGGRQTALAEILKRADGIPPSKAEREDIFYNLPPGSMARTRKRTAKAGKAC